jgi:7-carboxy-7-deazaguanine synthase
MLAKIETERTYSVNEIFGPTVQGEGPLAGALTHFIRFNGCDFRCDWCDSLSAVLPEEIKKPENNKRMTVPQIVEEIYRLDDISSAAWITLSGGNPALLNDKAGWELIRELRPDFEIAVETQGTIYRSWLENCDQIVLSPKPPSSGMSERNNWDVVQRLVMDLRREVALKVVVFPYEPADLEWAVKVHDKYAHLVPFYIQCGTAFKGKIWKDPNSGPTVSHMLADYRFLTQKALESDKFPRARVLPQLHLYLFGHGKGV